MPAQRLTIEALGLPAPQGSKRHVGNGRMIESSARVKPWREDVKQAALHALEEAPAWDRQAAQVFLHVTFTLPRPKAHYRTVGGERSPLLHGWAPTLHASSPDLDKLIRSTCDALTTAGVYADDSRVVQIIAQKAYETNVPSPYGAMDRTGARIVLSVRGER